MGHSFQMEETDSKGTALTPLTPHGASVESNVTLCWVRMGSGCPNNAKLPPLVTWPSIRDGDTWYQYPLANTQALINLDCEERCSVSVRPRNFKFEVFFFFSPQQKGVWEDAYNSKSYVRPRVPPLLWEDLFSWLGLLLSYLCLFGGSIAYIIYLLFIFAFLRTQMKMY